MNKKTRCQSLWHITVSLAVGGQWTVVSCGFQQTQAWWEFQQLPEEHPPFPSVPVSTIRASLQLGFEAICPRICVFPLITHDSTFVIALSRLDGSSPGLSFGHCFLLDFFPPASMHWNSIWPQYFLSLNIGLEKKNAQSASTMFILNNQLS